MGWAWGLTVAVHLCGLLLDAQDVAVLQLGIGERSRGADRFAHHRRLELDLLKDQERRALGEACPLDKQGHDLRQPHRL
jgi:hypothetical protein